MSEEKKKKHSDLFSLLSLVHILVLKSHLPVGMFRGTESTVPALQQGGKAANFLEVFRLRKGKQPGVRRGGISSLLAVKVQDSDCVGGNLKLIFQRKKSSILFLLSNRLVRERNVKIQTWFILHEDG